MDPLALIPGDIVRWQGMELRFLEQIASDDRIEAERMFGYVFEPTDDDDKAPADRGPERHLTVGQVREAALIRAEAA